VPCRRRCATSLALCEAVLRAMLGYTLQVPLPTSTHARPFLLILSCFFPFAVAPPLPWPAAVVSAPAHSRSRARLCNLAHASPSCTHARAHVS
jgi:hypothetical protein